MSTTAAKIERGLTFHRRGQLLEARASYEEALELEPGNFDGLHLTGLIETQTGNPRKGLELIRRAIAVNPRDAFARFNEGAAHQQLGQLSSALESYTAAIAIDGNFAAAYVNRALVLKDLERFEAALTDCNRAVAIGADFAEAHFNRGLVLGELARWGDALASLDRAISIRAEYPEAYFNRGVVLRQLGQFDAALASYDRAVSQRADYASAYVNRGSILKEFGRMEAAMADFDRAIALEPDEAEAWCNRGTVQHLLLRVNDALESYGQALRRRPDFAAAYNNRAYSRLLSGDLENGWRDHEWRWRNEYGPSARERRDFSQPLWLGDFSLSGRTILLHAEQGYGDTIQFCRYVCRVAALGAAVILEVQRPLVGLLAGLSDMTQVVARGEVLPAFDCHCPLLSLPLAFKTTLETIPRDVPYLRGAPDKLIYWSEKLGNARGPRVGLVWSGGFRPDLPAFWAGNGRRNIPLARFAPLKCPDIDFVSLQIGQPAESELAALSAQKWDGPHLQDFSSFIEDFSDTAAIIDNLDLVISVDTATAHLAGALGKPVWILNRFDTCWRWLLDRADSPWYPTARLYRQRRPGDWDEVIERVGADLRRWAV
jgi:tetratricopeptide (TPR) repeat protein